jgi:hypothetical protein
VRNVEEIEKNGWHDDSGQEMLSFREEFDAPIEEDQDSEEPAEMDF